MDSRGVAHLVLDRRESNNAYDGELIGAMLGALDALERTRPCAPPSSAAAWHFQAGADLKWIDAVRTARPKTTSGFARHRAGDQRASTRRRCRRSRSSRAAASAADPPRWPRATLWSRPTTRCSPSRRCAGAHRRDYHSAAQRRYRCAPGAPLCAHRRALRAAEARRIGLVHEVVPAAELAAAGARIVDQILQNGPEAIAQTKALALESAWTHFGEDAASRLIESHADNGAPPKRPKALPRLRKSARRGGHRPLNESLALFVT